MSRGLLLVLPTAVVLACLVAHSLRALPRRRAIAFWAAATAYGLARGLALRAVVERGLGASVPYRIHEPLLPIFGVPLQELAGWAIVAYLGWWIGDRFASARGRPRHALFLQVAWASLFLGSISWAIEAGAVAAGWWHWTIPVRWPLLGNVPLIGLVDWFFVGTDFLLPFLAFTAPASARSPWRWATLAAFPLHFVAHLGVEAPSPAFPIPPYHAAHWILLGLLLWGTLRGRRTGPTLGDPGRRARRLPHLAFGIILADLALVAVVVARQPGLLAALLPVLAVVVQALRPAWGYGLATLGLLAAPALPSLALAALPAAVDLLSRRPRGVRTPVAFVSMAALALAAWTVHRTALTDRRALEAELDRALRARDRGELALAEDRLRSAVENHPGAHAPAYLLGELRYRTGRLAAAGEALDQALAVLPDHLPSRRLRVVVALRRGRDDLATELVARGLAMSPGDPELTYLALRSRQASPAAWSGLDGLEPSTAGRIAALAYEVGDREGAGVLLDRSIERWPDHRAFYPSRVKLALAAGDGAAAHRTLERWRRRFPDDPEASRLVLAETDPGPATGR